MSNIDPEFDKKWKNAMKQLGENMVMQLKKNLQTNNTVGVNANLMSNVNYKIVDNAIEIEMPHYALYVEYGTPGKFEAPPGMAAKPGRKYPMKYMGTDSKGRKEFEYIPEWEAWMENKGATSKSEKFLLTKHIVEHGTRPHPFIRPAFDQHFMRLLRKALSQSFP